MAQPPPINGSDSHGKEGNIKFLMVENVVQPNAPPERRKAYFHQQVVHESSPIWNQIEHQHWSLPMAYENTNPWEFQPNAAHYAIRLPGQLPSQVQYAKGFPEFPRIPVIRIGNSQNWRTQEIIPGIRIEDDYKWLLKYFGVEIIDSIFMGKTGMFFSGSVFHALRSDYPNDLRRLERFMEKIVCIKMYITHQMTRPDQMDRLYEETLAHCELKHPNIVDTYSVRYRVRQAQNAQGDINAIDGMTDLHSYIIMEYSELGSMSMLLKKIVADKLGFDYYHLYLQDIISGLLYLHSTGRAHRELNQSNFLAVQAHRGFNFKEELNIKKPTAANCVIKICDFSFTKKFDEHQQIMMRGWQSMDAMDLGRNILWHCFNYFRIKLEGNRKLIDELLRIVRFLTVDDSEKRLDNLQSLKMKEGVDEGKNVRAFMNKVADGRDNA